MHTPQYNWCLYSNNGISQSFFPAIAEWISEVRLLANHIRISISVSMLIPVNKPSKPPEIKEQYEVPWKQRGSGKMNLKV